MFNNRKLRHGVLALIITTSGCGGQNESLTTVHQTQTAASVTYSAAKNHSELLQQIYVAYYGRPADPRGLTFWANAYGQADAPLNIPDLLKSYETSPTIRVLVDNFGVSQESLDLYSGTTEQFITAVYQNLFNRDPEPAGLAYWVKAVDSKVITRSVAALAIMAGSQSLDSLSIAQKVAGADSFTKALNSDALIRSYDGSAANALGRSTLKKITPSTTLAAIQDLVRLAIPEVQKISSLPTYKVALHATSYENAKINGLSPLTMPTEAMGAAAYARADFKGDGRFTLFAAWGTTDSNKPIEQATPGVFAFYTQAANGAWIKDTTMIDTPNGCIIPRKAVVADFNGDQKPDVLVACHGYDAAPFPGERNYLVESTASGVYRSHPLGEFIGFFHGAAAADLDGDSLIDFVATDGKDGISLRVFKNIGSGKFSEVYGVLPVGIGKGGYFSVELLDMNEDGKIDLVTGGHEYEGTPTFVLYGTSAPYFSQSNIVKLPAMPEAGVVLDFVKVGKKLFVGRTSGSTTDPTLFYKRLGIQTIDLTTNTMERSTYKDSLLFYWLLPTATGVISDRSDRPL